MMRLFQDEVYRNGKSEEEERERGDSLHAQDDMEEFLYQLEQGGAREEGWNKVRLWKPDRRDRWVQTEKEKMEVGMELLKESSNCGLEGRAGGGEGKNQDEEIEKDLIDKLKDDLENNPKLERCATGLEKNKQ